MKGEQATTEAPRKRRSPRHVKAAARMLQKEARRILRRQADRIAPEPVDGIRASIAAIDTLYGQADWARLEDEAEHLDELLHRHASFARKSDLRVTVENLLVAILAALGLRACFYEPFKIPSGSMMPTLRAGDFILVNKFVYGVQIPFTNTVVGDTFGTLQRGTVVVFRYPLDETDDYIKRVVGLPGDEVRVTGREVAIKRSGEREFTVLPHTLLSERCLDEAGEKPVSNCQLFEETLDGHTYVVRYLQLGDHHESRTWKVPEGHLMVMGDNRDQSSDSRAWTVTGEAVAADSLLTEKDLTDLTGDNQFTREQPQTQTVREDGRHDHVRYFAAHRSRAHDLVLDLWRDPSLGAEAVWDTAVARLSSPRVTTLAELLAKAPPGADTDRALGVGAGIDRLAVAQGPEHRQAVVLLDQARAVLRIHCGTEVCTDAAALARQVSTVVGRFHANPDQDVRSLVPTPEGPRYSSQWATGAPTRHHFFARELAKPGATGPRDRVRLRVFRQPGEGVLFVRDAALRALGSSSAEAERMPQLGEDAYLVPGPNGVAAVLVDASQKVVAVLECGSSACPTAGAGRRLAARIAEGLGDAAVHASRMRVLVTAGDVPGWEERPQPSPELTRFDHLALEATVRGEAYGVDVEVWLHPPEGLAAKVARRSREGGLQRDESVAQMGAFSARDEGFAYVFAVPESDSVIEIRCGRGLCPTQAVAQGLAVRAASKAKDPRTFIDPEAERPQPFVPRGNVKGRADRIWLPWSRFWLPIR